MKSPTPATPRALAWTTLTALLLIFARADAHVPFLIGGNPASWNNADLPVTFLIHAGEPADGGVDFESARTAIRLGFERWNDVPGTNFSFVEDTTSNPNQIATQGQGTAHTVMFDNDNSSGFLVPSILATTEVLATTSGRILDADIIFNDRDNEFTTTPGLGGVDVQSVLTHEAGHMLGLDHCVTIAGTMFPRVAPGRTHLRSLSTEDISGVRSVYPGSTPFGRISGRVVRASGGSGVSGAAVVALDGDGLVISTAHTQTNGDYLLDSLPPGQYQVYAQPFGGPVTGGDLSIPTPEIDFGTKFLGGNPTPTFVTATAGSTNTDQDITVGNSVIQLTEVSRRPALAPRGGNASFRFEGSGLDGVDETVSITGTGVSVAALNFSGGEYDIALTISTGATLGPRSLLVQDGSEVALLTGVVDVVDPAPSITTFSPLTGDGNGGTPLTIDGSGFQPNAVVFIGSRLATQVSVTSNQITCVTPGGPSGGAEVQVQNPDGQVDLAATPFQFQFQPTIQSVFPSAGSVDGGTSVAIGGVGFEPGATVTFDGVPAFVESLDFNLVRVTSPPGAGTVAVTVTNPTLLNDTESNAFTYVPHPDPTIDTIAPASGPTAGGETVEILGSGFLDGVSVVFGVDAAGNGGSVAASVERGSSSSLTAVTPQLSAGKLNVAVINRDGSKACLINGYEAIPPVASFSSGGGSSCSGVLILPVNRPWRPGDHFNALLPWLALLLYTWIAYRRARTARSRSTTLAV